MDGPLLRHVHSVTISIRHPLEYWAFVWASAALFFAP